MCKDKKEILQMTYKMVCSCYIKWENLKHKWSVSNKYQLILWQDGWGDSNNKDSIDTFDDCLNIKIEYCQLWNDIPNIKHYFIIL
jgi:hypothetical protein